MRDADGQRSGTEADGHGDTPGTPPLVAIGASAGGLAALEKVFAGVPERSGAAYVVLQHLSPDFESHMSELLGRVTALPVMQATDRIELKADRVYVIPPKKEMILSDGRLLLTDKDPRNAPSMPIDTFFRSMAQERGHLCIAVVLSGTGSDGARGVQEVKDAGGYVIVQQPDDAEFSGMPEKAVATGVVDEVLAAGEIPRRLSQLLPRISSGGNGNNHPERLDAATQKVLDILSQHHNVDFSSYKKTTLVRRIQRRLQLSNTRDVRSYADRITTDFEESKQLFTDLLIGVTEFFRDTAAYRRLSEAINASLFRDDANEVRVWVAGCATGEEAYSVAMLLDEARAVKGWKGRIRIFATDLHEAALRQASSGTYSAESLRKVSRERRERYFTEDGLNLRVVDSLRDMIVFASHNLVANAPFTQLDMICCRNVLIYFQPAMQARLLALFHFGLRTGGLLFLGPSETLGKLEDEFESISASARIFSKRRDLRLASHPGPISIKVGAENRSPTQPAASHRQRANEAVYGALLKRYMPASFVLDQSFQLLHSFGGAEGFLSIKGGTVSTVLPKLLDGRFRNAVAGLLDQYKHDPSRAYAVKVRGKDQSTSWRIQVSTLTLEGASRGGIVVELREMSDSGPSVGDVTTQETEAVATEYVESLERDLEHAREQLQTTVEELEASNEELQATNEELVASNEELQSTNEELRSVNEELHSVNLEHSRKITELTQVTEDLENLLHTIDVGVLFLDDELCIRRVNHRIGELLHILPQDIGRSFQHFKNNIDAPGLVETAQRAADGGRRADLEIRTQAGNVLLLQVLPYASPPRAPRAPRGVVLTLVDITALKAAESEAERLSFIVRSARDAIISKSLDGTILSWNSGAERVYGYSEAEAVGRHISLIVPEDRRSEIDHILSEIAKGEDVPPFETVRIGKEGRLLHMLVSVTPLRSEGGDVTGASVIAFDITDRKLAEQRASLAVEQRDRFLAMLSHELRNPLMGMMSANELLRCSDLDDESAQRAQETISRQVKQMARLLEDTLDASRMRYDKVELQRRPIDLRDVIEATMDATRPHAAHRSVTLDVDMTRGPVQVSGDASRLQQVIVNLTQNAINHSRDGGHVVLSLSSDDEYAVISVSDQGSGISPEALPQVFEPFFQDAPSRNGGLGLGLSLAQAVAFGHNGRITAESDGIGKGATFRLYLPLGDDTSETWSGLLPRKEHHGGHTDVLLIDDDEAAREGVAILLRKSGYNVTVAKDGAEALALVDDVKPSVALIDIGLPDMSGLDVARRVREKYARKQIRLIALTGYGRQEDREAALEAGCDMHLVKPVEFSTLERVIAYHVSG